MMTPTCQSVIPLFAVITPNYHLLPVIIVITRGINTTRTVPGLNAHR